MARPAGYSGTPLSKKLGIKPGTRVRVTGAPRDYPSLLEPLPADVHVSSRISKDLDIWHLFAHRKTALQKMLPEALQSIKQDGAIWVSWPKRASKVPTDITEDTVRDVALPLGLVDVKVCAVDAVWSGLKLVIRKELRRAPTEG